VPGSLPPVVAAVGAAPPGTDCVNDTVAGMGSGFGRIHALV
jgi:hypothetical protein